MKLEDLAFNVSEPTAIEPILHGLRDRFSVDNVAYAGSNPTTGRVFGFNTYDPKWQQHYMEQALYRIDPTLVEARRSVAPVDWTRLDRTPHFRTVFSQADDFGIVDQGLTVPVRGPLGDIGALSINSNASGREWDALKPTIIGELQAFAVHIHDKIVRADSPLQTLMQTPLSTREIEILQWIAAGKSQQDIGDILSLSHRTVEVHLRSSRTKLNALTTAQAIGRAISMGLIYPE